jgi:hypothetical protein
VTGPARLVAAIAKAHQFVTFCIPSNLQRAVAFGLQHEQPFYKQAVPTVEMAQALLRCSYSKWWCGCLPVCGASEAEPTQSTAHVCDWQHA